MRKSAIIKWIAPFVLGVAIFFAAPNLAAEEAVSESTSEGAIAESVQDEVEANADDQIEQIEGKTADGEAGEGWFDRIERSLGDLRDSLFDGGESTEQATANAEAD